MKKKSNLSEIKNLITCCCQGNLDAKKEFQHRFGMAIYNFPINTFRIDEERSAEFYLYAFENDRLFKRLRNFKGKKISFENYLKYFVLKDLALEWIRGESKKLIKSKSLDDDKSPVSYRNLSAENEICSGDYRKSESRMLEMLRKSKFLILRILFMYEIPISSDDLKHIADSTKRSLRDIVKHIAKIERNLSEQSLKQSEKHEKLNTLFIRRIEYQRLLVKLEEDLNLAIQNKKYSDVEILEIDKKELERKYAWRLRQTYRIAEKDPNAIISTSYKDIAELLGTSIGSISAKIYKAKAYLKKEYLT